MSLEQLNFIFQILASCAVVVSLLYLAVQTRQTARNQQAQMHAMRLQAIRDDIRILSAPDFHPVWVAGMGADPDLGASDAGRFLGTGYGLLLNFQEQYHEFQEGMINLRRWEPSRLAMRRLMGAPGFRAVFHTYRNEFDPQFVMFVDQQLADMKSKPPAKAGYDRWAEFAKQERAALTAAP